MHSCELVVTPPIQGAALLLELGTLIIEGRNSKSGFVFRTGQNVQSNNVSDDRKESEIYVNSDVGRGALPKRPATSSSNVAHLSPAKRNRDQDGQSEPGDDSKSSLDDPKARLPKVSHKRLQYFTEETDPGKIASTSKVSENLSVYEIKARLANAGPLRGPADALWRDHTPLCIEVLLAPDCGSCREPLLLLERWTMSVYSRRTQDSSSHITSQWLLNAVRSQLHFSQISAWAAKLKEEELVKEQEHRAKVARDLSPSERQRKLSRETCNFKKYESNCDQEDEPSKESSLRKLNVVYNLRIPDETYKSLVFQCQQLKHTFPITDIGNNVYLEVRLESLPRIEDIPLVNCACALTSDVPSRRKSRDVSSEPTFTEDILAKKLAVACSLANKISKLSVDSEDLKNRSKGSTFCTDSSVINSDMGCTSGISRKFPLYSSPNVTEFGYHSLSSRGSTPERSDLNLNDSGFFSSKQEVKSNSETVAESAMGNDDSYQYADGSNNQVPLNKLISTDYLLVDDRMQTACREKGKHRCNCDDESDQGASKDHRTPSNIVLFSSSREDYLGTGQKVTSDEKKIKEMTKHLRRQRKEARLRQMKPNQESPLIQLKIDSGKKVRTFSSSENSDGRSSPELVHYNNICHGCFCKHQEQQKHNFESNNAPKDVSVSTPSNLLCTNNGDKHPESSTSTTSIPILQASKFDHVNRFGCFKSTLRAPREFYCLKQQQGTSESYAKFYNCSSTKHCNNNESPSDFHRCYCTVVSSKITDDDYRPSTKKLISSATQTDDMLCECGKSLIPKCLECSNNAPDDVYWKSCEESARVTMKRSDANHNLAEVSKSSLLLNAIVRAQRGDSDAESCDSDELKMGHDKKVIDYNCDNSVNMLNNCECDKNIVYSDSFNKSSCTNESLSPLISDNVNATTIRSGDEASPTSSDLSILVENNNSIDSSNMRHFESSSHMKYLGRKEKPPDVDEAKPEFVIKKPKLKRSSQTIDKINRIILDRNQQKSKDIFLNNENGNTVDRKRLNGDTDDNGAQSAILSHHDNNKLNNTRQTSPETNQIADADQIILYEKGDYGTFGKIVESSSSNRSLNFCEKMEKFSDIKKEMFNYNVSGISFSTNLLDHSAVPSISEMDKFRYRLDSAASMVFHSRTGLPLTSSPAPLRRGKSCFDYDSSINSVSGIKSALYGLSNGDLETPDPNPAWSPGSSPGSPSHAHIESSIFNYNVVPKTLNQPLPVLNRSNKFRHGTSSGLLGSFEESVLNGRLEPAATVAGFTAEIGASGEFCPAHLTVPVTVFFYSLGDNTTSSPYLGHINLGRKGYCVPRAGTIQVTLFNPHGTVVKMFVVMYNLEDMPPHSRTFLRQRTLWGGTCLRYLIHLRFLSSKSGKVYLHTDIRIIVSRKADLDTAAAHSLSSALVANSNNNNCDKSEFVSKGRKSKVETGTFRKRTKDEKCNIEARKLNRSIGCYELSAHCAADDLSKFKRDLNQNRQTFPVNSLQSLQSAVTKELSYELRSFTYGPENPKYSPR